MSKDKAVLSGTDLENHRREDPKSVHGVFPLVKTFVDGIVETVNEDPINDEMTFDNTWRTFDLSVKSHYSGQSYVILGIHCQVLTAGYYAWFKAARYGSTTARIYCHARGAIENLDEDPVESHDGAEAWIPLDSSGRFYYRGHTDVGTVSVIVNGYIR